MHRIDEAMTEVSHMRALEQAEKGVGDHRVWAREQALSGDASPQDLEEYVWSTRLLLQLDRRYWLAVAEANAACVAERRPLSPPERQAVVAQTLAPFQALLDEYEARTNLLLAQLSTIVQDLADTQRRRTWIFQLETLLWHHALALRDAVNAMRARAQGRAPTAG